MLNSISKNHLAMITEIAKGLQELINDVIFVGGTVSMFYIDDRASETIRPTIDVDCVIKVATYIEYSKLEEKLRNFPCYIASKLTAYLSRGQNDPRTSHDMEDIILVLDGRSNLMDLAKGTECAVRFLKDEFRNLQTDKTFLEALTGYLGNNEVAAQRIQRIISFLSIFTK